jgi:hypothetical protein
MYKMVLVLIAFGLSLSLSVCVLVWVCHPVSLNFYGSSNKKYENKSRKIKEKCCFYNFFLVVLFKKLWKQQIEQ